MPFLLRNTAPCTLIAALGLLAAIMSNSAQHLQVDAHGFTTSPRSRNYRAHQEGREYDHNGLNRKLSGSNRYGSGLCGVVGGRNYDNVFNGRWRSEATYSAGQEITISTTTTAFHGGHFEVGACADTNPTQDCFDRNKLTYVGGGHARDPSYPFRAYLGEAAFRVEQRQYNHRFRLPSGLSGDRVLLQWRYFTGNSCKYSGYDQYFQARGWRRPNLPTCNNAVLDDDGGTVPERFWNCMEVTIRGGGGGNPTPTPPSPTPPSSGGGGTCGRGRRGNGRCADSRLCCSRYGWCGTSSAHCSGGPAPSPTPPAPTPTPGTCGGGRRGNGRCANSSLCCSSYGWCGTSSAHCSGGSAPSPTPSPGYCNWNNCDGRKVGGWCDRSSSNCSRCSGRWCR